jgi:DNA primase
MNSTVSKEEQRYKLERLKSAIDAEQLLRMLGFEITRVTNDEIRAACAVHGGDNKSSFRMDKHTKNWMCFSHGCHDEIGYDVISLVKHMLHFTFTESVKYLESITGVNVHNEADYIEYKRYKDRQEAIQQSDNRKMPTALVDEAYLKGFKKFRSEYFEQIKNGAFPKEVLDEFEIGGGYVDKFGFQRDVIPIRDKNKRLVAYSCRDITDKAPYEYKYLLTEGFDKDKVLYNLQRAKNFMGESKTIIVVEGFKSVWKLYMAGYKNVVACMGSRITSGQQALLYSTAFNVITLFDGDEAGMSGTQKALKDMKEKIRISPLFLPDEIDPADRSIEYLQDLIGII